LANVGRTWRMRWGHRRQFCRGGERRITDGAERVDAVCRLSNICERYDVLVDLEGYPIISNSEAIHIITGVGFRKLKRLGQGSVNGDLIQDAFLEGSFEFFQLLFGCVRVVDVREVKPVLSRGRVSCYPEKLGSPSH
jgi:hypothetical protein